MRIEYSLTGEQDEMDLGREFCALITNLIKHEIKDSLYRYKMQQKEQDLINAEWIQWKSKPKNLNVVKLCYYIADNIIFKCRRNNSYLIEVNRSVTMRYSNTPLEAVARFLDKGNNVSQYTGFIDKVFKKYRDNIKKYWESFIFKKLNRLAVSSIVLIS